MKKVVNNERGSGEGTAILVFAIPFLIIIIGVTVWIYKSISNYPSGLGGG